MELRSWHARGHGGPETSQKKMKNKYLEKKQHQSKSTCLVTHVLPPTPSLLEVIDHIKVGCYYEIDHSKLNPRTTPQQLHSVRVVMVSEKGPLKVCVRYPSVGSLHAHITQGGFENPLAKKIPALNNKYVMPPEMASEVLYRRIPPQELSDWSNVWGFWAVRRPTGKTTGNYYHRRSSSPIQAISGGGGGGSIVDGSSSVVSKKGPCWSELKFTGMVKWGKRRQVRYLRRHEQLPSSDDDEDTEKKGNELVELDEYDDVEDEEKTEDDDEEDDVKTEEEEEEPPPVMATKMNLRKRKPPPVRKSKTVTKKRRAAKRQKQNQIVVVPDESNKQLAKRTISRWSAVRYKLAEENMLKVMKAKGATIERPILRPALRSEARKQVGDTGLLDHLLKHMAGRVAPGGTERFRRRHNADGAMEYWLESADLVKVRKEAGVQDPYWTPPPGWKPGDHLTQDPTCAKEINDLKQQLAQIRREVQGSSVSRKQNDMAIVVANSNSCLTSLDWEHDGSPSINPKDIYAELMVKKGRIDEQLMEASHSLCGIEETCAELRSKKVKVEEQLRKVTHSLSGMEERIGMMKKSSNLEEVAVNISKGTEAPQPVSESDQREMTTRENYEGQKSKSAAAEDKAAKIERLRSGFRICRPQGTFLWPNMGTNAISPHEQNDLNDPLLVVSSPTPPSASSSSAAAATHHLCITIPSPPAQLPGGPTTNLGSPPAVRPLAERRPVNTATLCNVTTTTPPSAAAEPSKSNNVSFLLNLNEPPNALNNCDTTATTSSNATATATATALSARALTTYQRRHANATKSAMALSRLVIKAEKEGDQLDHDGNARKESKEQQQHDDQQRWYSSTPPPPPPPPTASWMGEKWWLSVGTPSPSLENNSTLLQG